VSPHDVRKCDTLDISKFKYLESLSVHNIDYLDLSELKHLEDLEIVNAEKMYSGINSELRCLEISCVNNTQEVEKLKSLQKFVVNYDMGKQLKTKKLNTELVGKDEHSETTPDEQEEEVEDASGWYNPFSRVLSYFGFW
jgi:hypothetical protein